MVLCFIFSVGAISDSLHNASIKDGHGKKWSAVKHYKSGEVEDGVYQFIPHNPTEGLIVHFDNFRVKEVRKATSNWDNPRQY